MPKKSKPVATKNAFTENRITKTLNRTAGMWSYTLTLWSGERDCHITIPSEIAENIISDLELRPVPELHHDTSDVYLILK